jgi:hypothetical protein
MKVVALLGPLTSILFRGYCSFRPIATSDATIRCHQHFVNSNFKKQNSRSINLPKSCQSAQVQDSAKEFRTSAFCESLLVWTKALPCKRPDKIAVIYHKDYSIEGWDPNHRFVMSKFEEIMKAIGEHHILKSSIRVISPDAIASPEILEMVHCPEYVQSFITGSLNAAAIRKIGLPWSPSLVRRTCLEVHFMSQGL